MERLLLIFVFLTGVLALYDPVADPKAVVNFGRARFTVLTPTLVRMQLSRDGKYFDDRPTIQIVNRKLPVPQFSVSNPNTSTVVITTSQLTLTHITTYIPDGGDTCSNPQTNTDQVDGTRVPDHPNGLTAGSQQDCCSACNKDKSCTAWVYATNQPTENCWLMMDVKSTTGATDRVFGGSNGGSGFTAANLQVQFTSNNNKVVWTPGSRNSKNLGGTITAMDCYSTKEQCLTEYQNGIGPGLLTTDGWYVLDDTKTSRYDATLPPKMKSLADIPWFNDTFSDQEDIYFFGDGLNYRDTIRNYALIGGFPAMPPRSAFGVWWSRYFAYSQQQFTDEILQGYASNKIPLSQVVLDMDWHTEDNSAGCDAWGGYTFNTKLFPQPQQFISWLHSHNNTLGHPVKLLLNVHPQSGVDHCQGNYDAFARAMGVDPASKKTIPCDFGNPQFASNVYSIFLDAQPLTGVDFWWTDYGGCGGPAGRSLYWSNYYFDAHLQVVRQKRPLVLSRYGGLGSQRYPIGFSGDTFQAFLTLDFEVQMTPMAANVLFGYWSHDIGGFHNGNGSPGDGDPKNETGSELLLRWIQFGAVAPIDRTHCDHCERRVWLFPHFVWMRQAFVLRNALVPYIYTNSRKAYETGISMVHPMYYDNPSDTSAYTYNTQYMFGDDIVAGPITTVSNPSSHTISKSVWLPPGTWSNWNGTQLYHGPTVVTETYGVQDIPLFVRSDSVIPLQTEASVVSSFADPIMWTIFPGAVSGSGQIYEDDGDSLDYIDNKFAVTTVSYTMGTGSTTITVKPTLGGFTGMPQFRSHIVQIRKGSAKSVTVNGKIIQPGTGTPGWYISNTFGLDITENALIISTGQFSVQTQITVEVMN